MKYKYETHMHTSEGSACGFSTGAEMAIAYKKAGYDGIIVTDHFFNGHTAVDRSLPWREKICDFCKGYENAKRQGEKIGLSVFFGWEYAYEGSEFLTYGLDKNWLLANPGIMTMPVYEYITFAKSHGGYIVQAHPFRQECYIKRFTLLPEVTDAVEVYNQRNSDPAQNARAEWYAESYGLAKTAGSDCHTADRPGKSGVSLDYKLNSIDDYIEAVRWGNLEIIKS